MAEQKKVITLEGSECSELVEYLMETRNRRIEEGKPIERVSDLMIRIIDSPSKKEARKIDREAR